MTYSEFLRYTLAVAHGRMTPEFAARQMADESAQEFPYVLEGMR